MTLSYIFYLQHVQVSHATDGSSPKFVFLRPPPVTDAAYGPDGRVLRTSVCADIEESVQRAAAIEKELSNPKVELL